MPQTLSFYPQLQPETIRHVTPSLAHLSQGCSQLPRYSHTVVRKTLPKVLLWQQASLQALCKCQTENNCAILCECHHYVWCPQPDMTYLCCRTESVVHSRCQGTSESAAIFTKQHVTSNSKVCSPSRLLALRGAPAGGCAHKRARWEWRGRYPEHP